MSDSDQNLSPRGILFRYLEPAGPPDALLEEVELLRADHGSRGEAREEFEAQVLYMARDLVLLQQGLSPLETRALFVLTLCTFSSNRQGSTRLPLDFNVDGALGRLLSTIVPRGLAGQAGWSVKELLGALQSIIEGARAGDLFGVEKDYKPFIIADGHLYHQRMVHFEDRLVDALSARLAIETTALSELASEDISRALEEILANAPGAMALNEEQQAGVVKSLSAPMTIITGGPGTGKTSVVVSILRLLGRVGVDLDAIALAAPTGKAAHRMAESIEAQLKALDPLLDTDRKLFEANPRAGTIHRLLGYSPRQKSFYHHRNNPLPHQVVIVDEASMIDLFLMEQLVSALGEGAHLVLLGDADQLPSVDTGAVLRDLVEDPLVPTGAHTVRLKKSYRMDLDRAAGRKIFLLALQVGDVHRTLPLGDLIDEEDGLPLMMPRANVTELTHQGVELLPGDLRALVDHWFSERVLAMSDFDRFIDGSFYYGDSDFDEVSKERLDALFAHYGSFRLLTVTRVYGTGSERINAAFHRRFLSRKDQDGARWDYVAGEPVMMLRNDYERGLFNGDQGLILWVRRKGQARSDLMVVFPDKHGYRPFFLGALRPHLEHAFAMTIHKSQGSEFKQVALILPEEDMAMLTREVLYTGLTRASESVTVVGSGELFDRGSKRSLTRFSGISQKLVARHGPFEPTLQRPVRPSAKPAVPKPVQGDLFSVE